jgi:hypothetical protein
MIKYKLTKWNLLGINKRKQNAIYSKLRQRAKQQIIKKYYKEYKNLFNLLQGREYLILSTGYELLPLKKGIRIKEHIKKIKQTNKIGLK